MSELTFDIGRYIAQLAPHMIGRKGNVLLGCAQNELINAEQREAALMVFNNKLHKEMERASLMLKKCDYTPALSVLLTTLRDTPEQSLTAHNKRIRDEAIDELVATLNTFGYWSNSSEKVVVEAEDIESAATALKENNHAP